MEDGKNQIDNSQNQQDPTVNVQSINQVSQNTLSFNQLATNLSNSLPTLIADTFVYDPCIKFTLIESLASMEPILQKAQMSPNQRSDYGMNLFSLRLSLACEQIAFKEKLSQSYRLSFSSVGFSRYVSSNEKFQIVDRPHHTASSFITENSETYIRLLFCRNNFQVRITRFQEILTNFVAGSVT